MVLPITILIRRERLLLKKHNIHFRVFLGLISIIIALMHFDLL